MAFTLYVTVEVPEFTNGANEPDWVHPQCHAQRVRVGSFNTERRAERAAERLKHVRLDDTRIVLPHNIRIIEIVEE